MKKAYKYIGLGVGGFVICIVLLITVFYFFIQSPSMHQRIQKQINSQLNGTLTWDHVSVSPFSGAATIEHIVLTDRSSAPVLIIDSVSADISLSELLYGRLTVEQIHLQHPSIKILMDKDRMLNFSTIFSTPDSSSKKESKHFPVMNLKINEFKISDATVEFQSNADHITSTVQLSAVAGGNLMDQSGFIKLTVKEADFQSKKIRTYLTKPLIFKADLTQGRMDPISLTASTPQVDVILSGIIHQIFSDPIFDICLNLKGHMAEIRNIASIRQPLDGTTDMMITCKGKWNQPVITTHILGEHVNILGTDVKKILLDAELANYVLKLKSAEIVTSSYGDLSLQGTLDASPILSEQTNPPRIFSEILEKMTVQLNGTLHADMSGLQSMITLPSEWNGQLDTQIQIDGSLNNPKMDALLKYHGGKIGGYAIDQINFKAALADKIFFIQTFDTTAGAGTISLTGEIDLKKAFPQGFLSSHDLNELGYQLHITSNQFDLHNISGKNRSINGNISGNIQLKGKGVSRHRLSAAVTGNVNGKQVSFHSETDPVNISIVANGMLDQHMAHLKDLKLTIQPFRSQSAKSSPSDIQPLLRFEATGNMNMDSKTMVADIFLNAPELNAALMPIGVREVCGGITLSGKVSGNVKYPEANLSVTANNLCFQDIQIGSLTANIQSTPDGVLTISKLNIDNQGSIISGNGSIQIFDPKGIKKLSNRIELSFQQVELKDFVKNKPVEGIFDGNLMLQGSLSDISGKARLIGKNVGYEAYKFGNTDLDMRLDRGQLILDSGTIKNRKSTLRLKGAASVFQPDTMAFIPSPNFSIAIDPSSLDLEDFMEHISGNIRIEGYVGGKLDAVNGNVRIRGKQMDIAHQKIQDLSVDLRMDGQKIFVQPLTILVAPQESITGDGWVSVQKDYAFWLKSDGISFNNVSVLKKLNTLQGIASVDLTGQGSLDNPQVSGNLFVKGLKINQTPLDDIQLRLALEKQRVQISGKINFDINGWLDMGTRQFSTTITCQQTDLKPYITILSIPDITGSLTGTIHASGYLSNLDQIQGKIDLATLYIAYKGEEMIAANNVIASLSSNILTFPENHMKFLKYGTLTIGGSGTIPDVQVDLRAQIPMKAVSIFNNDLSDVTGTIAITAQMKGITPKPAVTASVQLNDIGIILPTIRQKLHKTSGSILVDSQTVTLNKITGMLDTGRFTIDGIVHHSNFIPSKISLKASAISVPFQIPDTLQALVNADLNVSGTPENSLAKGEIVILDGMYKKDIELNLQDVIQKKRTTPSVSKAPPNIPFLKHMNLDISIKHRHPFLVRNKFANLDLTSDLKISGTYSNPIVTGRAAIESGTIVYEKRELTVKKGGVDFVNPYRTEPVIDIESEIKIRKWDIVLKLSGTPEEIVMELSSNPPESHGDIMSLLVFGRTTKELIEKEGGSSQSPSQMVGEIIANSVGQHIRKKTGIDVFEVEMYQDNEGKKASDRVKVTMGKELSRRMTVKYVIDSVDGEIANKAVAEYKFLENLMLTGFQDSKGAFGTELRFRLEFR